MKEIVSEIYSQLTALDVNLSNSLFRMLLSMVLGVVIGAERKRKGQIAGIRTFSLITMGACLAMLLSIY
ncbi:MAG: MgtC/SapB family protein, partial [Muribaculaceae bacterium]|nr:MgtC/SapB family protein [Muribaculaceae bacterium]